MVIVKMGHKSHWTTYIFHYHLSFVFVFLDKRRVKIHPLPFWTSKLVKYTFPPFSFSKNILLYPSRILAYIFYSYSLASSPLQQNFILELKMLFSEQNFLWLLFFWIWYITLLGVIMSMRFNTFGTLPFYPS